jgi:S-adenosylmethionine hydrolase
LGIGTNREAGSDPGPAICTFLTDFGLASPYVAAVKGVLLSVCPEARLVDLSHDVPPQDIAYASEFLAACVPYYPLGCLHVVVVDPGVGTERAILYAEIGGQRLLAPDNGVLSRLADEHGPVTVVRTLTNPRHWRPTISATFHGRDIFAPVAGHLLNGLNPADLGPLATDWLRRPRPEVTPQDDGIRCVVAFVDHFGNLITSLPANMIPETAQLEIDGQQVECHPVRTYGEAAPGELVRLISSDGRLELAVVQGNAAERLGATVGSVVHLRHQTPD